SGQLIFYEPLSGGYKSQWGSINKRKDFEEFQSINVNAITLHTAIVRAVNSSNIDSKIALWIDVEGATYDVLVGSDKLVQENISVVFAELNDTQAYESSATSIKVIDYMLNAGFVPIARDNEWQDAWNIVFIHESLVPSLQEIILPWLAEEARLISKGL
ncbi:FkbM family methyltransferase, partial [uncultured Methylobacterium sp.]|uniref:FkbM family methyltransferase n=1 Tax=uncultured Methylobacterium sp. TaxID=157278 RepID=UPI0035C95FDF